jgi:hypothetical protein
VGMESTGCYWRPVWQLLEDQVECWLLNAAHLHNVPGRTTDVADAAWIAQLVEHGLDQGVAYQELGEDYVQQRHSAERHQRQLVRQLERLGHKVTLEPTESA